MTNGHDGGGDQPRPRNLRGRLRAAVNGALTALNSKLALAVLPVGLTVLVGPFLLQYYKDHEEKGVSIAADLKEREKNARSLNSFVDTVIGQRSFYTKEMYNEFNRNIADRRSAELWQKYQSARYNASIADSNAEIGIEDDGNIPDGRKRYLSAYLEYAIDPTFDKIDACITQIYDTLNQESKNVASRIDAAKKIMLDCQLREKISTLQDCVGTFSYYFSLITRMDEHKLQESANPIVWARDWQYNLAADKRTWCKRRQGVLAACELDATYERMQLELDNACRPIADVDGIKSYL